MLAELEREVDPVDFQPWHDLQDWIANRNTRVEVPFVDALADPRR